MKILQVNVTCGMGSTGKIAVGIGEVLKKIGDQSYIAYGYYNTCINNTLKLKHGNSANSLRIELMRCRLTGYYGFTSKRATYKLIEWINTVQPDIIHLHNIHGGFVHIEILFDYLSSLNKPIIWTLHDCWSFTGHCAHFDYVGCQKWKTGCYECQQKKEYPRRYFFDRSKEQYERKKKAFTKPKNINLVTPSKWLADIVKESFLKDYPIHTINNGINLDVFHPVVNNIKEKYNILDKKLVLAVASTWSQRKGLNYVIDIAEALDDRYRVCIIGLNKRQKRSLPNHIIGIERTNNQEELTKFYTAADVFVNTTVEDNFPTVNLEALACGTPVITFDTGGSPECIDKNVGCVVGKEDVRAMISKIKLFSEMDVKKECISYAHNHFDEKKKYIEYINLYKKVIYG